MRLSDCSKDIHTIICSVMITLAMQERPPQHTANSEVRKGKNDHFIM